MAGRPDAVHGIGRIAGRLGIRHADSRGLARRPASGFSQLRRRLVGPGGSRTAVRMLLGNDLAPPVRAQGERRGVSPPVRSWLIEDGEWKLDDGGWRIERREVRGAMPIVERHSSPDGLLQLIVDRADDGDWSVGFDGYEWHTHGDLLTLEYGGTPQSAVRALIDEVL